MCTCTLLHVRLYIKHMYIENVSLWLKIKQKNLEICTSLLVSLLVYKMYKSRGMVTVHFSAEPQYPGRYR